MWLVLLKGNNEVGFGSAPFRLDPPGHEVHVGPNKGRSIGVDLKNEVGHTPSLVLSPTSHSGWL